MPIGTDKGLAPLARMLHRAGVSTKLLAVLSAVAVLAVSVAHGAEESAMEHNRLLGRGVNLGNALDAPQEGAWGITLKAEDFQLIAQAGFQSVRIPIRWSTHALPAPPYSIAPDFFARVDWAIKQAVSRGLRAVINVHHYEELYKDPAAERPRLLALWEQIAARYRDTPDTLYFELLNEPTGELTDERWQEMFPEILKTARKTNPDRMVIIGPGYWNNLEHLDALHLPEDDRRLIVTFHYYQPFRFTHQQASWVKGSEAWKDITWTGTASEQAAIRRDLERAAAWGKKQGRPLYMGEFGSYQVADMESRVRWTDAVSREAEKLGFSWAYWAFSNDFGVFDPAKNIWRDPLLRALIPKQR